MFHDVMLIGLAAVLAEFILALDASNGHLETNHPTDEAMNMFFGGLHRPRMLIARLVSLHQLVEHDRLGWLSPQEFVELLALCQVLPGPNIVNLALMFGDRHFGVRGALAAAGGLLTAPLLIVLAVATAYRGVADVPVVSGALRGMGAVAAGLVVSTAVKLWGTLERNPIGRPASVVLAVSTWVTVGWLRWPMVWVVLGLGSASTAWAWWRMRRARFDR